MPANPLTLLATIAPPLAALDNAQDAIDIAEMQIAPKLCGSQRPLLVSYLAAHILTMGQRAESTGAAGNVSGLSEGGLSVSFSGSGVAGSLGQTSYGAEYDRISRSCIMTPMTRVTSVLNRG